jgi:hypothetical protein
VADLSVLNCYYPDGSTEIISCWKPSLWERVKILFTGKVFVHLLAVQHPPLYVSTDTRHIKEIEKAYDQALQELEQWN